MKKKTFTTKKKKNRYEEASKDLEDKKYYKLLTLREINELLKKK